ncbi:P-loop containing nucleoside triphosphate hydrolase protein [Gigaspora rosea]|uniref:P-loop containing nucleoside triphosphate hydrolase protein n=1 Tax=Gigaspora rosea TaxID=44941 RepID=A0A397UUD1_9GLOM|nr:P-loop containing nucleoside triphosphate hydrolase protein [Gigaspora rosea]
MPNFVDGFSTTDISTYTSEIRDCINFIYHQGSNNWFKMLYTYSDIIASQMERIDDSSFDRLINMLTSPHVFKQTNEVYIDILRSLSSNNVLFEKLINYMLVSWGNHNFLSYLKLLGSILTVTPIPIKYVKRIPLDHLNQVLKKKTPKIEFNVFEEEYYITNLKRLQNKANISNLDTDKIDLTPEYYDGLETAISYITNRIKKPLDPSFKEIFDLEALIQEPVVPRNFIDRSWNIKYPEVYWGVHYDLLRHELVEPLKRSSAAFYATFNSTSPGRPFNKCVFYKDVRVIHSYIRADCQVLVRVGFNSSRPVDWYSGQHLMYGTYVLLFKIDSKSKCVDESSLTFAYVEDFDIDGLVTAEGESYIGLNFDIDRFKKLDLGGRYFMFESPVQYRYVKTCLQWLASKETDDLTEMPLRQEIFGIGITRSSDFIPHYLKKCTLDLAPILSNDKHFHIVVGQDKLPQYEGTNGASSYNVEKSIKVALEHIICSRVAVVQAPSVTSKSILVSKAIQLITQAFGRRHLPSPIIILTKTSFVLDKILEELLPIYPQLVRLGSSDCRNPLLSSRQINNVSKERLRARNQLGLQKVQKHEWLKLRGKLIDISNDIRCQSIQRFKCLSYEEFIRNSPINFKYQLVEKKNDNNEALQRSDELKGYKKWVSECETSLDPLFDISEDMINKLKDSYLFGNNFDDGDEDIVSILSENEKHLLNLVTEDRFIDLIDEDMPEQQDIWYKKINIDHTSRANKYSEFWSTIKIPDDIWSLTLEERKKIRLKYDFAVNSHFNSTIKELHIQALDISSKLDHLRLIRWSEIVQFAPIIGITMTYAPTFREIIQNSGSRICIVDEASDIPEAELMSTLSLDKLEHLILIGDKHISKPDVRSVIAQRGHRNISLFERWMRIGGKSVELTQQSRMHPKIYRLVNVLYNSRLNIDSRANNIPSISGIATNLFFMSHIRCDKVTENGVIRNEFEAELVANFAFYLFQQEHNFDPQQITILTPFKAQKQLIWSKLDPKLKQNSVITIRPPRRGDNGIQKTLGKIRVKLIDEYRNEENAIVILSLVNVAEPLRDKVMKILDSKDMAVVSLSRALHGLYIFGDCKMLEKSNVWKPVIDKIKEVGAFGACLELKCINHGTLTKIWRPEDFKELVQYGGCKKPCQKALLCGHHCSRTCHPIPHAKEKEHICKNKDCKPDSLIPPLSKSE